ncbi:MAG TPA: IclR family transcriptional regulator [Burkholderiaceae bacterium]|nr:IclR family transcriptional regulator [Burkholderiaceae bacterium]
MDAAANRSKRGAKTVKAAPFARDEDPDDRDFVTAVGRAFSILRCFSRRARILGNKDLAQRTGLPKSTIARLTHTLTKLGYLEYLPALEKYQLGIGVLTIGQSYLAGLDVRDVARPLMQQLADETKATVALGANHGNDMVFLELCHGSESMFLLRMQVGERVPHGMTALGRAYLAGLTPEQRAALGAQFKKLVKADEWTKLKADSDQAVRDYEQYGFCFSLGDWNKEVFAAGVPMISDDGRRILAFSCSGPAHQMTRKRLISEIGPKLMQLRDRVKEQLGGSF